MSHLIRVEDDALLEVFRQANPGQLVYIDWGEPDEAGVYNPTFRVVDPRQLLAAAIGLHTSSDLPGMSPDALVAMSAYTRRLLLGQVSTPESDSDVRENSPAPARAHTRGRAKEFSSNPPGRTSSKEASSGE